MRYLPAEGSTIQEMRDHAQQSELFQQGDMKLVWVNEGDLALNDITQALAQNSEPLGVDLGDVSDLCES